MNGQSWKSILISVFIGLGLILLAGCSEKASDKNNVVDDDTTKLLSGTVSLSSGSKSIASKTTASKSLASKHLTDAALTDGKVQLYKATDVNYSTPLLTTAIEIDSNGTYDITFGDFKNQSDVNTSGNYVIRAIVITDDGQSYELSALKTGTTSTVAVDPVATMIKAKIMETIQSTFGSGLDITDDIFIAVESLASSISTQVKAQVEAGTLVLKPTQFETKVTPDEFAADATVAVGAGESKMALELENVDVAELSLLESTFKNQKLETDLKALDLSSTTGDTYAKAKYNMVSAIVKSSNMAVHLGDGNISVFLPVPPEYMNNLPGVKYTEGTFGNDPAIRRISANDLKNIKGHEIWAEQLLHKIEGFMMPNSMIKAMLMAKKNGYVATFDQLGTLIEAMEGTNPFTDLNVTITGDMNTSSSKLVGAFKKNVLVEAYNHFFWDKLQLSMDAYFSTIDWSGSISEGNTTKFEEFLAVFGAKDTDTDSSAFIERVSGLPFFTEVVKKKAKALAQSIPQSYDKNASVLQWKAMTVDKNTGLTPLALFMFTELIMSGGDADFVKDTLDPNDALYELDWMANAPSDDPVTTLVTLAKTAPNEGIWVVDWDSAANGGGGDMSAICDSAPTNEAEGIGCFMKAMVKVMAYGDATATASGSVADIIGEFDTEFTGAFGTLMSSIGNLMQGENGLWDKVWKAKNSEFGNNDSWFGDKEQKSTTIKMVIKGSDGNPTNEYNLSIAPLYESLTSYEWKEGAKQKITPNSSGEINGSVTLYKESVRFVYNENTKSYTKVDPAQAQDQEQFRFTGMFRFNMVQSDGTETFVGEWPLFPSNVNDLQEFWFDPNWFTGKNDEFAEFKDENQMPNDNVFAYFNTDSAETSIFYPNFVTNDFNKVGENILAFDKTDFKITKSESYAGTLQGAIITLTAVATSWDEQNNYWMSMDPNSGVEAPATVTLTDGLPLDVRDSSGNTPSGTYGDGTLVKIDINSTSLQTKTLYMNVNFVSANTQTGFKEVEVSLFPDYSEFGPMDGGDNSMGMSEADFTAKYSAVAIASSDISGKLVKLDIPMGYGSHKQALVYFKTGGTFEFSEEEHKDDMDPGLTEMPAVETGTWSIADGKIVVTGSDGKTNTLIMTNKPEASSIQFAEFFSKETNDDGSTGYYGPLYAPEIDTPATLVNADLSGKQAAGTNTWTEFDGTTVTEAFTAKFNAGGNFTIDFVRNGVAEPGESGTWTVSDGHAIIAMTDPDTDESMSFSLYFVKDGTAITKMYGMMPGEPFGPEAITVSAIQ